MAKCQDTRIAPARASITKQELLTGFVSTVAAVVCEAMESGDTALADNIVRWADLVIVEQML